MKILFTFAFIILLISCTVQEEEVNYTPIVHKSINIKNGYIGKPGPIIFIDNKIIGIDFMLDSCFFYFNTINPELHRFGTRGQGPNDFLFPYTLQFLNKNLLGVYDITAKKYNEIEIKDSIKLTKSYPIHNDFMAFNYKKLPNNQYLSIGAYKDAMFIITDSLGENKKSFYQYPYKDNHEKSIKNHLRAMAYQGNLCCNYSNDQLVYTSLMGNIIHFYKLNNNQLEIINKIEISYPKYKVEETENGFGSPLNKSNKVGYISAAATNQYIYLLYSGIKIEDFIKKNEELHGNKLFIYNWKGKKISNLKLDVNCFSITVSPDNRTLWGIANNPDPELVYFELPAID